MSNPGPGSATRQEIFQQPELWPTTLARVDAAQTQLDLGRRLAGKRILFTGAGTSAYAARAAATAGTNCLAVPTTDLLVDAERHLAGVDVLVSLARSGGSPESAAVVERVRALRPDALQLAITCNPESALTRSALDGILLLDPRTNDRSLVMTGSFSNLVLAGQALLQRQAVSEAVTICARHGQSLLPVLDEACRAVAGAARERIVMLSSSPLQAWAQEAGLKALEMTAGAFPVVTETFLGLRHGPMSFVRGDTLVIALLSSDPLRRLYEQDLLRELRAKRIGYLVGIADVEKADGLFDAVIPAMAPRLADELRTPFEIVAAQLFGYHLSLARGIDPDNPSPGGVINRVVQGVTIHPARPAR